MLTAHRILFWLRVAAVGAVGLAAFHPVLAQQIPNLTEAAQRAIQAQQAGQQNDETLKPNIQIYQPVNPEQLNKAPPSRLEALYSARAGRPLMQFGYDILGVPSPVSSAQFGAVQDDYVLGAGDEIVVVLRGQENDSYRQRVDRDGKIILPKLNPIQAAGRSFGDFRGDVETQIARSYISTNAFVSLGEVRQISVLVTGEVRAPGTRVLSGMATPLDALLISGGIAKTGSLRNVALIRGNQTRLIDLYALLTQGNLAALGSLQNGDRIYVPPLQGTVAVTGFVRRPGIYELKSGQPALADDTLIALAGGYEIAGAYRLSKMRLEPDGTMRLVPFVQGGDVADGEILFVDSNIDVSLERVSLAGAVRLGGNYPLTTAPSVARLIHGVEDVTPDAYTLFAVIVRRDAKLNTRSLIPFSLARILSGTGNIPLQNDDVVYIFSRTEVMALADAAARAVAPVGPESAAVIDGTATTPTAAGALTPGVSLDPRLQAAQKELTSTTAAVAQAAATSEESNLPKDVFDAPGLRPEYRTAVENTAAALGMKAEVLVRMASDHLLWLLDEVRDPGAYLAAGGTTLGEMITVAGGALDQADLSFVEVTSTNINALGGTSQTSRTGYRGNLPDFEQVALRPLDVVRLRPVFSDRDQGQVIISGQVRYPGNFDFTRGERLSSLLERAGGLTDEAYSYGAIFTRRRAAITEHEANLRSAREIESQIATAGASAIGAQEQSVADRATVLTALAQQLRNAPVLGRISVTADPALLRVKPELDILLEPGDTLYIPKRPSIVTVSGEVLNSGSFQFETGLGVKDYVERAGGTSQGADEGRTFLVLPDGSARLVQENWLSFNNTSMIPPGSTIIVPRDLQPFNLSQFLKDATQITSQLAITAASIAVIGRP